MVNTRSDVVIVFFKMFIILFLLSLCVCMCLGYWYLSVLYYLFGMLRFGNVVDGFVFWCKML